MGLLWITIAAFVGVAALVGGLAMTFRNESASKLEDRLDLLTGTNTPAAAKDGLMKEASVLARPLDSAPGIFEVFLERFGDLALVFEQADTSLTISKTMLISSFLAAGGVALSMVLGIHAALMPVVGLFMAVLPLLWVLFRRKRRLKAFAAQLPDALEMLARSLRAGQSLGFGFHMVASEMSDPISREFNRVFEEQNLGIPLDETLEGLTHRVPNLDLKFFAIAVILQRQTGGDLAEILDKIGSLIRDRFRIWGQVQALTGEGRLSGVVLLALPFVLFVAVYQLNRDYIMVLFTDPMGRKMLAIAIIMQIIGALVIRKIVNIKV
ncbi:MAG: secretion protein [Planctomycetes bacterium RBG_13_63_9]|nr:MAG: secretion protein [Planctomycetes bacterium RBG_13_63_9]